MGKNSETASGIFKSDFILAAIIPNRKNRITGVRRFDWINCNISIDHFKIKFAEIKIKTLLTVEQMDYQENEYSSHYSVTDIYNNMKILFTYLLSKLQYINNDSVTDGQY